MFAIHVSDEVLLQNIQGTPTKQQQNSTQFYFIDTFLLNEKNIWAGS